MGWNIFKKNDKEISLEERVNMALLKAKEDRRIAQKEIKDINNWAADAIIDTYSAFFPNAKLTYYRKQYAETALAEYESIKTKFSEKLELEIVEKCDNIVTGYLNQIQLRESKLKLYEKIELEYQKTKEKLKNAQKVEDRTNNMQEHEERLKSLDNDSSGISKAMTETYKLEDLKEDIEQKEEYLNQLEKLTNQFSDDSNFDNSLAFKDEIDKMINDMD
ncbi:MAG: hypothetical protein JXR51_08715 [Bacteroidales bacterium]|nr:hypothetical protein [Bacteroidales bacterium]MBN2757245.1 hypothetical protein [Bacteroidales bacterium]